MNQNRRKVHLVHAVWLHRHWRLPAGTVTDLIWSGAPHYSTPGDVWRDEQLMKRMEINHIGPKWEEGKKKGGNMHKTASITCHGGKKYTAWHICDRTLLESRIFLCVRKQTKKCEYHQKNIFLTVYPQKNTHRNIMTEKFNCSVYSPSETISLWVLHPQKNCVSPD